jgi:hypothetical protein
MPDTIIISYPRSGLNWIRYCIEFFSGQPTPGLPVLITEGSPIVCRTHDVRSQNPDDMARTPFYDATGQPKFSRAVLLLRNYRECFVREANCQLPRMEAYGANIAAFDVFPGDKHLLYYEDLIGNFDQMRMLLDFLRIDTRDKPFDLAHHRFVSTYMYHARHTAHTRTQPENFTFHSSRLNPQQLNEIDTWLRAQLQPPLFERYVARYLSI